MYQFEFSDLDFGEAFVNDHQNAFNKDIFSLYSTYRAAITI